MSLRLGLLTILTLGDAYGYQLRQEFDARSGTSTPTNVGQVYSTLDRLERDELVSKGSADEAGHVHYSLTESGRAAARDWLESAADPELRITLAASLPRVDVVAIIDRQLENVRAHRGAANSSESFARSLRTAALQAQLEAQENWLIQTRNRVGAADHAVGLEQLPGRGRPTRTA
jgi:DNA-binding PadR family transcriptional regulator